MRLHSSEVLKCSARCSEFNDVSLVTSDPSLRELARSGQVRVGGGQVWYQNVQLDELNPMIITFGSGGWNTLEPKPSLSPKCLDKEFIFRQIVKTFNIKSSKDSLWLIVFHTYDYQLMYWKILLKQNQKHLILDPSYYISLPSSC